MTKEYRIVSIGATSSIGNLSAYFFSSINQEVGYFTQIRASGALIAKHELDKEIPVRSSLASISHISSIEFVDVDLKYGDKLVTAHLNLRFTEKKKYIISGPSGSGKTTLMKCILGIHDEFAGALRINELDSAAVNLDDYRNLISYISQDAIVLDGSLRFNLTLGDDYSDEAIALALHSSGLEDFVEALPDKLDTMITENGKNISGGQRQRISIARAMLREKNVLLIDEGTSALDQGLSRTIELELFRNPDLMILMITHHYHRYLEAYVDQTITL